MFNSINPKGSQAQQPGSILETFFLRVWLEHGARPVMRGWIQHIASRRSRHFTHLTEVEAFIRRELEKPEGKHER